MNNRQKYIRRVDYLFECDRILRIEFKINEKTMFTSKYWIINVYHAPYYLDGNDRSSDISKDPVEFTLNYKNEKLWLDDIERFTRVVKENEVMFG